MTNSLPPTSRSSTKTTDRRSTATDSVLTPELKAGTFREDITVSMRLAISLEEAGRG
jgi:hypothetical protein